MWIRYNPNPCGKRVGDCTIRAISKALNQSWDKTYWQMSIFGYLHCDLLNSNNLWTYFLKEKGFKMRIILDEYPDYYTVEDFCTDHPKGTYVLGTGSHAVAVVDGCYYDAWDSGNEIPIYYFERQE